METTLAVPNAILFILDPGNNILPVPEYKPGQAVSANDTCVSVSTRAPVDGNVTVRLITISKLPPEDDSLTVFEGNIFTPSRKLAVTTSNSETIFEVDVASDSTKLWIGVDDLSGASQVHVAVLVSG